jgi:hypothetical protein
MNSPRPRQQSAEPREQREPLGVIIENDVTITEIQGVGGRATRQSYAADSGFAIFGQ